MWGHFAKVCRWKMLRGNTSRDAVSRIVVSRDIKPVYILITFPSVTCIPMKIYLY